MEICLEKIDREKMAQIYLRKDSTDSSSDGANIWDDTELLKAYDRAVNSTKKIIDSRLNGHKNETDATVKKTTWTVGAPCRAVYDEDGIEYEATIESIDDETCTVKFVGYGNSQKVALGEILTTHGPETRTVQEYDAEMSMNPEVIELPSQTQRMRKAPRFNSFDFGEADFPPPPPLPPNIVRNDDDGALSAMLMSWYMSGYYTGYYQGSRSAGSRNQGKRNRSEVQQTLK